MNKKTKALTTEQYKEIIQTMREGFSGCRPNERIATALVLEGNLGLRISDILQLHPRDIIRDGSMNFTEIAYFLSYSSLQYFSKQFKNATGMSPSEYASSVKGISIFLKRPEDYGITPPPGRN